MSPFDSSMMKRINGTKRQTQNSSPLISLNTHRLVRLFQPSKCIHCTFVSNRSLSKWSLFDEIDLIKRIRAQPTFQWQRYMRLDLQHTKCQAGHLFFLLAKFHEFRESCLLCRKIHNYFINTKLCISLILNKRFDNDVVYIVLPKGLKWTLWQISKFCQVRPLRRHWI